MGSVSRDFVAVIVTVVIGSCSALECFTCSNATVVSDCKTTQTCGNGEICFAEYIQTSNGVRYTFGCRAEKACGAISAVTNVTTQMPMNLVGRSTSAGPCVECCKEHHCNRQLCQHSFSAMECSDGIELDCVTLEKLLNICSDTKRAITACRRFCGLCYYTDGDWSAWSTWSNCDVTCGNGTQTRIRRCTNPAPSQDGLPCNGSESEMQTCVLQKCPVHGGWAQWSPWGSCSATCGVGMQRRDRSCSNPYPDRFGDHCFGDSRDDKLCVDAVCPVTDGGWSAWYTWTTCTVTCNGGMHTRNRNCNSPSPSVGGKYCVGSPYEVAACSTQKCPRYLSSFSFSDPKAYRCVDVFHLKFNCLVAFSSILQQEGTFYDSSTGIFTCRYPGHYVLVATLTGTALRCNILKNNNVIASMVQQNEGGIVSITASAYAHLLQGDKVQVMCAQLVSLEVPSSFSGFLLAADE